MNLKEAIQRLAGTWGKANFRTFDATVETVDISSRTCVVNSLDSSVVGLTVRFMVEVSDGDMSVPKQDSTVTVAMTDFTEPYIVSHTWLDNKLIIIGNQSIDVKPDKQIYNNGEYGGWAIVKDPDDATAGLLAKIKQLEQKVNDINVALQTTSIALASAGTYPLTTNPNVAALSNIAPLTSENDISNPNITHGKQF